MLENEADAAAADEGPLVVGHGCQVNSFEKNLAASKNGAELINAMKQSYPQVTDGALSLDIGAKVNKGEMKW